MAQFSTKQFFMFRYLITSKPDDAHPKPLPNPKGAVVRDNLGIAKGEREFEYGKTEFVFTGFKKATAFVPTVPVDRREVLYIGKLGMRRTVELGDRVPGDIVDKESDDWRRSWMVIDLRAQLVAVEVNRAIGGAERIKNILMHGLGGSVPKEFGHRLEFQIVANPGEFWKTIDEAEKVFNVRFEFKAPNIDDLDIDVHELLEDVERDTRFDKAQVAVTSDKGRLVVKKKGLLAKLAEYTSLGGGDWLTITQPIGSKERLTSKSQDNAVLVRAEVPTRRVPDENVAGTFRNEEVDTEKYVLASILAEISRLNDRKG